MIRTLMTLVATTVVMLALTGCDSGGTASDAPKGGALRPVQENKREAPSMGDGGAMEAADPGAPGAAGAAGGRRGAAGDGG